MALYISKQELDDFLNEASQSNLNNLDQSTSKYQLNELIETVKDQEELMLKNAFGIDGLTREKLKESLKDLEKKYPTLQKINDNSMRMIVLQYQVKSKVDTAKDQIAFQNALKLAWDQWEPNNNTKKTIDNLLMKIVNEVFEENPNNENIGKAKITNLSALTRRGITLKEDIERVSLNDLAEVTQSRIILWLEQYKKEKISPNKAKSGTKKDYNKSLLEVNTDLDWYSITKGRAGKGALKLSEKTIRKQKNDFKEAFKQFIGGDIPNIDMILDYVLSKSRTDKNGNEVENTSIYVGGNANQIVGLSGEIQALCYLSCLLGDKFKLSPDVLDWTAMNLSGGKELHADITLQQFGIQVKNSIKTIIDEVDFIDSSFDAFLTRLETQNIIDAKMHEDIISVYEAYYFNVPYLFTIGGTKKEKNCLLSVKEGYGEQNKSFWKTREQILRLHILADGIIKNLIGELLYIGTGDAMKNETGNVLFFIKGKVIFASEILEEISNAIDIKKSNFNANITYNSSFTIVNFLQEQGLEAFNHPSMSGFFDDDVRKKILLKSSYNFSDLYWKALNK